jgi:hypothetical protein
MFSTPVQTGARRLCTVVRTAPTVMRIALGTELAAMTQTGGGIGDEG